MNEDGAHTRKKVHHPTIVTVLAAAIRLKLASKLAPMNGRMTTGKGDSEKRFAQPPRVSLWRALSLLNVECNLNGFSRVKSRREAVLCRAQWRRGKINNNRRPALDDDEDVGALPDASTRHCAGQVPPVCENGENKPRVSFKREPKVCDTP